MPALNASTPRIRLFRNERLEKLTLISARAFAIAWGFLLPFIAWMGWEAAGPIEGVGLFAAGLIVWTLFEYVMHRHLFHLELEQPAVKWLVFLIHGNHHDNPNDPLRGIMPLSVSLPIAGLIWAGCMALIGPAGTWAFLGFITGYVVYDAIHYACHQWPMRGKLAAALKRHHMRHHYVDDTRNYAISAIFWDSLFLTRITSLKK